MEYDYEAWETKKDELRSLVQSAVPSSMTKADHVADCLLQGFIRLTPPAKPEHVIKFLTIQDLGRGGGRSQKPGNIYLNMEKLMDLVPDVTIAAAASATSQYWLLPFIGLYIWNKLWRGGTEELSQAEATIIYALWKHRNADNKIAEDEGFEKTNATRAAAGLEALTRREFTRSVNRLLELECIEMEDGVIWMREWVRISY